MKETRLVPDVSQSVYWDNKKLARYGLTFETFREGIESGTISYWGMVAKEEARIQLEGLGNSYSKQ